MMIENLLSMPPDAAQAHLRRLPRQMRLSQVRELAASADREFQHSPAQARDWLALAAAGLGRLAEPELRADLLYQQARAEAILGHFAHGIELIEEAAALYANLGLARKTARTKLGLMHVLTSVARYDEALGAGLAARAVFAQHGTPLELAMTEENLGLIYRRLDQHRLALAQYDRAMLIYQQLDDRNRLYRATANRAIALEHLGQSQQARDLYEQAIAGFVAGGQTLDALYATDNLAAVLTQQGHYYDALQAFARAQVLQNELAAASGERPLLVLPLKRGHAYLALNLLPEAIAAYDEAIALFAQSGLIFEQAQALLHKALAQIKRRQIIAAVALLDAAEALFAQIGNQVWQAIVTLHRVGLQTRPVSAAALAQVQAAIALFNSRGLALREAEALLLLAELTLAAGDGLAAQGLWTTVQQMAGDLGVRQLLYQAQHGLARCAEQAGHADQARTYYRAALTSLNDLRGTLPTETFRTAFLADKLTVYENYVRLCLVQGDPAWQQEAFQVIEAAKSRALLDLLLGTLPAPGTASAPAEAPAADALRAELTWFYNQLLADSVHAPESASSGAESGERQAQHLAHVRHEISVREQALHELGLASGAALTFQPLFEQAPPTLPEVQAMLAPGTQMLVYYVLEQEVLAFVISPQRFLVFPCLCRVDQVNRTLERLRLQMGKFDYGPDYVQTRGAALERAAATHLHALYRLLLAPVRGVLTGSALTIVPHGPLHHVPFHALHDGSDYLVTQFAFSYAPSVMTLAVCRQRPLAELARALLMAVPDRTIPHVVEEVEAIRPFFPAAQVFVGADATCAQLAQWAPQSDLIHLATHALFRADNPLFSAIKLGDRWALARDLYSLRLRGGLVTLSACESGRSAVESGDELMGLARGFLVAGASALIASQWVVNDATTATFMTSLYRFLRQGQRLGQALRNAQLVLRQSHPHPYYWAPFVLIGQA